VAPLSKRARGARWARGRVEARRPRRARGGEGLRSTSSSIVNYFYVARGLSGFTGEPHPPEYKHRDEVNPPHLGPREALNSC
jgi:hypothetical protein